MGQTEWALRAIEEDVHGREILRRLSAARGAINSIMVELIEDHILKHVPRKTRSSAEAAQDFMETVRSYLN